MQAYAKFIRIQIGAILYILCIAKTSDLFNKTVLFWFTIRLKKRMLPALLRYRQAGILAVICRAIRLVLYRM